MKEQRFKLIKQISLYDSFLERCEKTLQNTASIISDEAKEQLNLRMQQLQRNKSVCQHQLFEIQKQEQEQIAQTQNLQQKAQKQKDLQMKEEVEKQIQQTTTRLAYLAQQIPNMDDTLAYVKNVYSQSNLQKLMQKDDFGAMLEQISQFLLQDPQKMDFHDRLAFLQAKHFKIEQMQTLQELQKEENNKQEKKQLFKQNQITNIFSTPQVKIAKQFCFAPKTFLSPRNDEILLQEATGISFLQINQFQTALPQFPLQILISDIQIGVLLPQSVQIFDLKLENCKIVSIDATWLFAKGSSQCRFVEVGEGEVCAIGAEQILLAGQRVGLDFEFSVKGLKGIEFDGRQIRLKTDSGERKIDLFGEMLDEMEDDL